MLDLKELGRKCKEFRQAHGWTQQDVADGLGISREIVSGFECGRSRNLKILFWYIDRGLKVNEAVKS